MILLHTAGGDAQDLTYLGLGIAAFAAGRWAMNRFVSQVVAPVVLLKDNDRNRNRLEENVWYTVYYVLSVAFGLYTIWDEPVATDFSQIYADYPNTPIGPLLSFYTMIELAFYMQGLFSLVFIEPRKKDFWEMFLHHCVTITLILLSFCGRYHRCGIVVLILHDISDIFLYVTKVVHLTRYPTVRDMLFVCFAVTFFVTRVVFFPLKVIPIPWQEYAAEADNRVPGFYYDGSSNAITEITERGTCLMGYCAATHKILTNFLYVLFCLHCFWFVLIARMIIRAVMAKGVEGDIRSDSENEDNEPRHKRIAREKAEALVRLNTSMNSSFNSSMSDGDGITGITHLAARVVGDKTEKDKKKHK